ncbi:MULTISPECIES: helicase-related protein [unclassified Paenibacillus]|uniref:helicase-related protein n=1 Tax=unclassified Paenibacillus TaxID=185978 RepID=UPI0024075727|nr:MULTISPECIES: helicase-related protein [unclassified Paenibacillus]MDF9840130.1 competence protein ComFA [Paenibacillus sp. PastF-2]MDF9846712.1 competence protein ComFA [Paenibacillus sp. PastM-2]MDF9852939.1 competence protein ComFA [Paenibacillus sp. PastF-1]MDH6478556.1 competence protein ComFA [Paenibacillus sp. PastH-2]MDH6505946.1 competence protein ComFA [Paenibacillus sp. PastM-3]
MRVSVYAAATEGRWKLWISVCPAVDWLWWSGRGGHGWNCNKADGLVMLSAGLPLGWGVKLRDKLEYSNAMQKWTAAEWRACMIDILKREIRAEETARGQRMEEWAWELFDVRDMGDGRAGWSDRDAGKPRSDEDLWFDAPGCMREVSYYADSLVAMLYGRSLLQPEVEALLVEQAEGAERRWRAAAQLAHLQGRLKLEAAVGHVSVSGGGKGDDCSGVGSIRWKAVQAALRLPPLLWRGAARRRADARCLRCGSAATGRTPCAACGLLCCAYCEACLALGRSRSCALLIRSAASPAVRCTAAGTSPTVAARRWGLSAAQAGAAGAALGFLAARGKRATREGPERFLLWAVTGAGKTEITFPLLDAVLAAGGRAAVATPRRDVVLELAPRLARAFPAASLAVLYGGSPDRWIPGRITIATTHQLMRFYQAFDLVIIDELDAFPYHNDPMLAFAAGQACKPDGAFIFLSATPPRQLQREVSFGRLPHARVPVRFHGHPLPVPQHLTMNPVHLCIKKGGLPRAFIQALRRSLAREAQVFLFVSRIAHIEPLLVLLCRIFPDVRIEGTSSQDPFRPAKVMSFRGREIRMLVTTTILERGVTVPRSDVYILDADSSLFDEASLVQMAGRAGRSQEDPAGTVLFLSPQWTSSQRKAIAQIRTMNAIACRRGYLKGRK